MNTYNINIIEVNFLTNIHQLHYYTLLLSLFGILNEMFQGHLFNVFFKNRNAQTPTRTNPVLFLANEYNLHNTHVLDLKM